MGIERTTSRLKCFKKMPAAVAINNINKRYRAKSELGKCLLAILDSSFAILDSRFSARPLSSLYCQGRMLAQLPNYDKNFLSAFSTVSFQCGSLSSYMYLYMWMWAYIWECVCVRLCVRVCASMCACEKSIRMYQYLCERLGLILIFKVSTHIHTQTLIYTHKQKYSRTRTRTHSHMCVCDWYVCWQPSLQLCVNIGIICTNAFQFKARFAEFIAYFQAPRSRKCWKHWKTVVVVGFALTVN